MLVPCRRSASRTRLERAMMIPHGAWAYSNRLTGPRIVRASMSTEDGRVRRISISRQMRAGCLRMLRSAKLVGCSGNFGLSLDGKYLAVSCAETKERASRRMRVARGGGDTPREADQQRVAAASFMPGRLIVRPSRLPRGSARKADIFTVPLAGGAARLASRPTP